MNKKKISGVYKITNKITGDFYIGSSCNIEKRWYQHKNSAFWKQHPNVKLYQIMAKYGRDNFTIEVVEETDSLKEREQYWVDQLKPSYNVRRANGQDIKIYKQRYNRLCLYKGKILKLSALRKRFQRQGISHSYMEAKNYLIEKEETYQQKNLVN